jgi:hypothetical protein
MPLPRETFLPVTRFLMSGLTSSSSSTRLFPELRGSASPEVFVLGVGEGDGGAGAYSDSPESSPESLDDEESEGVDVDWTAWKEASRSDGEGVGRYVSESEYGVDLSERGLG